MSFCYFELGRRKIECIDRLHDIKIDKLSADYNGAQHGLVEIHQVVT